MRRINRFRLGVLMPIMLAVCLPWFAVAEGQNEAASGEPMDITWQFRFEDSWFMQELNQKFNVNIISNGVWNNNRDQVDLMFASGDIPDVFTRGSSLEHYDEGITRSIPESWIRQYGPEYTKIADDHPWAWLVHRSPDADDEQLALGGIGMTTMWVQYYPAFRVDWARNVGVDLPGYDANKVSLDDVGRVFFYDFSRDIEWWEDLLIAFRDGDPDGNGKKDTIPMAAANQSFARVWSAIIGSFGVDTWDVEVDVKGSANFVENGKMVLTLTSERYRTFLRWMAKWYEMGLIDPEMPSLPRNAMWEKIAAGQVGVSFAASLTDTGRQASRPPDSLIKKEDLGSGAEVVMTQLPIGPDGHQFAKMNRSNLPESSHPTQIRFDVSDEKVKKIIEMYDYYNCNLEGWIGKMYGKEGVHFDWSGAPMASQAKVRKADDVPDGYLKTGKFVVYPAMYLLRNFKFLYPPKLNDFILDYAMVEDKGLQYAVRPYKWDQFNETGLADVYFQYGEGLNSLMEEFFFKAITGAADLDSDWDNYVKQFMDNGGREYIAELEKAPIMNELIKGNKVY